MTADCKSKRRQLRFFLPAAVVALFLASPGLRAQTKAPHSHDPSDWPRSYPVSLHFKDAPLSRVVQELKSHGPPNVEFEYDILNREGLSRRPVSIDVDRVPFWQAVAELSIGSRCGLKFSYRRDGDVTVEFNERDYPVFKHFCVAGPALLLGERQKVTIDQSSKKEADAVVVRACGFWTLNNLDGEFTVTDYSALLVSPSEKEERSLKPLISAQAATGEHGRSQRIIFPLPDDWRVKQERTAVVRIEMEACPELTRVRLQLKPGASFDASAFNCKVVKIDRTTEKSVVEIAVTAPGEKRFFIQQPQFIDSKGAAQAAKAILYSTGNPGAIRVDEDGNLAKSVELVMGIAEPYVATFRIPISDER